MFHRQNIVMIYDLCDHTWQLVLETWPGYFEISTTVQELVLLQLIIFIPFPDRKPVYFGTLYLVLDQRTIKKKKKYWRVLARNKKIC